MATNAKINDAELRNLLDEVAADLAKAFDSEKESLAKSGQESGGEVSHDVEHAGKMPAADKHGQPGQGAKQWTNQKAEDGISHEVSHSESVSPASNTAAHGQPGQGAKQFAKDFPPEEGSASAGSASAPEASGSSGSASEPEASMDAGSASPGDEAPGNDQPAGDPQEDPAAGGDPAADQGAELTPEALQAEYAKLDPQELEMHIHAALAAKEAIMGAAGGAAAPAMGAPPAPAPEVGAPADGAGPAMKKEASMTPEKVKAMAKAEVDELRTQLKEQAEAIEALTKTLTTVMEKPLRKSIASVRPVEAPKKDLSNLTMADVNSHLAKITSRPDLKKADRDIINDFFDRRVGIDKLAHLFEDYAK